ncbi:MAG: hypothetical protein U0163_11590 [Gemmatimonadaceae bacterium]
MHAGDLHPRPRYLKISEGYDHGCAFCTIPLMRGRHRSFAYDDVLREAQLLELRGARNQPRGSGPRALRARRSGRGLTQLLRGLLDTDVPWYRLLYIYSAGLTAPNGRWRASRVVRISISRCSTHPIACWSACGNQSVGNATRAHPSHSRDHSGSGNPDHRDRRIPRESEADVDELLEFLEEIQVERVGVFTYSAQEGTRAFGLADDVPEPESPGTAGTRHSLQRVITAERYERYVGRHVRALVDRREADGMAIARTTAQADDIDGVTYVATSAPPGTELEVRIDAVMDDYDFSATEARVLSLPVALPQARRVLPVAASTIGSYGR